jgi:hypothetical protein
MTVPAVVLISLSSFLLFNIGKAGQPAELVSVDDAPITRQTNAYAATETFFSIQERSKSLSQAMGADFVPAKINSKINCSTLDISLTSRMGFFEYESRLKGMKAVTSKSQATVFVFTNDWAGSADFTANYLERSSTYLGGLLKTEAGPSVNADWKSLGLEILPAAVSFCDLDDVFNPTRKTLQTFDAQIARVMGIFIQ